MVRCGSPMTAGLSDGGVVLETTKSFRCLCKETDKSVGMVTKYQAAMGICGFRDQLLRTIAILIVRTVRQHSESVIERVSR